MFEVGGCHRAPIYKCPSMTLGLSKPTGIYEQSEYQKAIPAGSFITTGVCGEPAPINPGEHIVARFDGLGEVAVDLLDDA